MAFGDVGGAVTELVITCRTVVGSTEPIKCGQPVKLCGPYTVTNESDPYDSIFGQALADEEIDDQAIPVKVRGICIFEFQPAEDGDVPEVDGEGGVFMSGTPGKVILGSNGITLKVDAKQVHVLL